MVKAIVLLWALGDITLITSGIVWLPEELLMLSGDREPYDQKVWDLSGFRQVPSEVLLASTFLFMSISPYYSSTVWSQTSTTQNNTTSTK